MEVSGHEIAGAEAALVAPLAVSESAGVDAHANYVAPAVESDTFAVLAAAFGLDNKGDAEIPQGIGKAPQEQKLVRTSPYSLVREDLVPPSARVMPQVQHQRRRDAAGGSSDSTHAAATGNHPCEILDPYLKDGAGTASNGNWSIPRAPDALQTVRTAWLQCFEEWGIESRLRSRVDAASEEPLFDLMELDVLTWHLRTFLQQQGLQGCLDVPSGQPLRLHLLSDIFEVLHDPDKDLPRTLADGVNTGYFEPVYFSGIFKELAPHEGKSNTPPIDHEGNWQSAESNEAETEALIESEMSKGFVAEDVESLEVAQQIWPHKVVVSPLSVARAQGRKPRLCLDFSASGINGEQDIREQVSNTTIHEAKLAFRIASKRKPRRKLVAATFDVQDAHKIPKPRFHDQGLFFFKFKNRLLRYLRNHFGARHSAYWYARLAAALTRSLHNFLHLSHFLLCYVDDSLLLTEEGREFKDVSLCLAFLAVLKVPLSWHKTRIGNSIKYLGFMVHTDPWIEIPEDKVTRVLAFLRMLRKGSLVDRSTLKSGVGLLLWASSPYPLLRSWLPAFWRNIRNPVLRPISLFGAQLLEVSASLRADGTVSESAALSNVQKGWKLKKIGNVPYSEGNMEIAVQTAGEGRAKCYFAVYDSRRTKVTEDAERCARFWLATLPQLQEYSARSCFAPEWLQGMGAADASADSRIAVVGGWWHKDPTPKNEQEVRWFSMELRPDMFPAWFCMSLEPAKNIAFYEALAQVFLLQGQMEDSGKQLSRVPVAVRGWCDNEPTVGSAAKFYSGVKPLEFALQAMTFVSAEVGAECYISHLDGRRNVWADALSRRDKRSALGLQFSPSLEFRPDLQALLRRVWSQ